MKMLNKTLVFISIVCFFISCEKDKIDNLDFHKMEDRIGLWVNESRNDSLDFVDDTNLIRKGYPCHYEEYIYRISGDTLFVKQASLASDIETRHVFTDLNGKRVIISNMYITIGFADNSGVFTKQDTI